jgi:hypothetical protein
MHEMEMNQKVGQQVESWNINFHKWKGIWILFLFLKPILIKKGEHQFEKAIVISCAYIHPLWEVRVKIN